MNFLRPLLKFLGLRWSQQVAEDQVAIVIEEFNFILAQIN